MKKENILYCIIGVLLGFIVGFMFANTTNERGYAARASGAAGGQQQQTANLPPDHPPIENAGLYRELAGLKDLVMAYRQSANENERQRLYESIEELRAQANF